MFNGRGAPEEIGQMTDRPESPHRFDFWRVGTPDLAPNGLAGRCLGRRVVSDT
jgi:hypothetical protein